MLKKYARRFLSITAGIILGVMLLWKLAALALLSHLPIETYSRQKFAPFLPLKTPPTNTYSYLHDAAPIPYIKYDYPQVYLNEIRLTLDQKPAHPQATPRYRILAQRSNGDQVWIKHYDEFSGSSWMARICIGSGKRSYYDVNEDLVVISEDVIRRNSFQAVYDMVYGTTLSREYDKIRRNIAWTESGLVEQCVQAHLTAEKVALKFLDYYAHYIIVGDVRLTMETYQKWQLWDKNDQKLPEDLATNLANQYRSYFETVVPGLRVALTEPNQASASKELSAALTISRAPQK